MSDWRPIAEAPRDGTYLLLCAVPDGSMAIANWRKAERFSDGAWLEQDRDDYDLAPTHFMPLPEPPKE